MDDHPCLTPRVSLAPRRSGVSPKLQRRDSQRVREREIERDPGNELDGILYHRNFVFLFISNIYKSNAMTERAALVT